MPSSAKYGLTELASNNSETEVFFTDAHNRIAKAAYYKAEKRGFTAGYELVDWLEAEQELAKEDELYGRQ